MPRVDLRLTATDRRLDAGFARIRAAAGLPDGYRPDAIAATTDPEPDRLDMRHLPLRTLDPAGSMDLDQAMHLERTATGYRVNYAIADVARWVTPGGTLDTETQRRVMTVYCPDMRVPLHPTALSEGSGSLLPGLDRPAVLWRIDLDGDGAVAAVAVDRAIVRSRSRHDYTTAQHERDALSSGDIDHPWRLLATIGELRRAQEDARGGVSMNRPEQEVIKTDDGWQLAYRAVLPIEGDNAQLSLLTGMAAASIMLTAGIGILRTMPTADPERLARLRLRAHAIGIPWSAHEDYRDVLRRTDPNTPRGAAFLAAASSLFRGAAWTPFDGTPPTLTTHAAIAAPYAHVTAPLRRLVDRYATEICLAAQHNRPTPSWVRDALPHLGTTMATGAERTATVDRECTALVEAALLSGRVGDTFTCVVITETSVQLTDPAVTAKCTPESDTPLTPGTTMKVRLVEADVDTSTVRFTVAH